MIGLALVVVMVGIFLVRAGWGGERRLAVSGWAAAGGGLAVLTLRDGAWGLAIGTLAGMAAALALLLHAGWRSPSRPWRPAREAFIVVPPQRRLDMARRLAVFALAVPAAFAAAQWLAFGTASAARRHGAGEPDAVALMLVLPPILWSLIVTLQMTRRNTARMIVPPVIAALLGTVMWSAS